MTPDKRVEEIVEHAKKSLKQAGFIASTLNKQETADTQLEFILRYALTKYHQDLMREVVGKIKSHRKEIGATEGLKPNGHHTTSVHKKIKYNQAIDDIIKSLSK